MRSLLSVMAGVLLVVAGGSAQAQRPPENLNNKGGSGGGTPKISDRGACVQNGEDKSEEIAEAIGIAASGPGELIFDCLATVGQTVVLDDPAIPLTLTATNGGGIAVLEGGSLSSVSKFSAPVAMWVRNCDGCVIDGLNFNGKVGEQKGDTAVLLAVTESIGVVVENNIFRNAWSYDEATCPEGDCSSAALVGHSNVDAIWRYNMVFGTAGDTTRGIWLGNSDAPERSPWIEGNYIVSTGHSNLALLGTPKDDCEIIDCDDLTSHCGPVVRGNVLRFAGVSSMAIAANRWVQTRGVCIEDNHAQGAQHHGFQSDGLGSDRCALYRTSHITLRNNSSADHAVDNDGRKNTGIYVVNADHWTVEQNHVQRNEVGITISNASDVTIRDNYGIEENTGYGIRFTARSFDGEGSGVRHVRILNNRIVGTGSSTGIELSAVIEANGTEFPLPQTIDSVTIEDTIFEDVGTEVDLRAGTPCAITNVDGIDPGLIPPECSCYLPTEEPDPADPLPTGCPCDPALDDCDDLDMQTTDTCDPTESICFNVRDTCP